MLNYWEKMSDGEDYDRDNHDDDDGDDYDDGEEIDVIVDEDEE